MLLFEARRTVKLALPIIFGEMAQMLLHLIDTAMVGAVSYKHLAAASLVMNALNIPFVLGIGITISVSQLVSLAHGKRNSPLVSHYLFNGFILCALVAIIIATGLFFGHDVLRHLGQDPEVVELAIPFLKVMSLSLIPMLLFMTLKQFTDGLEFTRTAMILSIIALPLNVFLNWLLIFGNWGFPRMELIGAGIATLITRILIFIGLAIVIAYHKTFWRYMAVRKTQWMLNKQTWRELLKIGIPSSLQIGMEAAAFAVSGIIIGTISAEAQAAHQIALSCASFTFMASMGLSQAGSIRTSNALGAKDWTKIEWIGKSTLITALVYGSFCAVLFLVARNYLPLLFNDNATVVGMASLLLVFAAVFQISDSTQAIGAGLLRGIKDVNIPTVFIAISYWAIGIPVGYWLAFHWQLHAEGMWIGLIIGLSLSALASSSRFFILMKKRKAIR